MAAPLVRPGQLKYGDDIVEGIHNAPAALIEMLQGKNFGKLIIKPGADPTR
jgi:NADPH-dependent curcumin reductase CurA